jgi:hypothetical protein
MPSGIRILDDLFVCQIRIDSIALDKILSMGTEALHKNLRACPKWVGSSILSGCNVAHATLVINLFFRHWSSRSRFLSVTLETQHKTSDSYVFSNDRKRMIQHHQHIQERMKCIQQTRRRLAAYSMDSRNRAATVCCCIHSKASFCLWDGFRR